MEKIVGGHYKLKRKIGAGSFGEIYTAENTKTHRRVAIKFESVRTRVPQLSYESKLYSIFSGGTGIPKLHWYGTEDSHNIMVIDLLGKSLEDLLVQCRHKMSLKTVLMLADQMISCVEFIHNKNFIHRDIKPDNFVMGLGSNANQVFIIDYGLSKKYRDQHTHMHIPYIEGKSLTGTARYASVGALRGVEQSRRDDMESLGYVWLYLLRGDLPWMGLNGRDQKQKYDKICEVKAKTPFTKLCEGFPDEFVKYFNMVRDLRFTETPSYAEYRKMFRDLFNNLGYVYDYKYDWSMPLIRPTSSNHVRMQPLPVKDAANGSIQKSNDMPGSTLVKIQSVPMLLEDNKEKEKNNTPMFSNIRSSRRHKAREEEAQKRAANLYPPRNPPTNSALVGIRGKEDKPNANDNKAGDMKLKTSVPEKATAKPDDNAKLRPKTAEERVPMSALAMISKPRDHRHRLDERPISSRRDAAHRGLATRADKKKVEPPPTTNNTKKIKSNRKPLYHI